MAAGGGHGWRLLRADTPLGTLTVLELDQPWFECRFEPTEAFEAVEPLFAEKAATLEAGDVIRWEQAAERIQALNLVLEPLERGQTLSEFLLHVYGDGTARLRYA